METLSPGLVENPTPDNLTLSDIESIEFEILLDLVINDMDREGIR